MQTGTRPSSWPGAPLLAASLAWSACQCLAAEGTAPASALARLARSGEVACQPSLPYFCRNLHVACAGQTSIPTFPFRLKAHGTIESSADTDNLLVHYQRGRLVWDRDGAYVILLAPHGGYVKLLSDGTYSFRHYAPLGAVMSIGRCS